MNGCSQQGRKRKLLFGYLLGISCFILIDLCLGDRLSDALTNAALWFPLNLIYGALIFLVARRIHIMQVSPVLEINGFLIGACPLLEVSPPYMERLDMAGVLLRDHLIIFLIVNAVMLSLLIALKKQ